VDLPYRTGAEGNADVVAASASITQVLALSQSRVELLQQLWVQLGELGRAEDRLDVLAAEALVAFARCVLKFGDFEPFFDELADQDFALRVALLVHLVEQLRQLDLSGLLTIEESAPQLPALACQRIRASRYDCAERGTALYGLAGAYP